MGLFVYQRLSGSTPQFDSGPSSGARSDTIDGESDAVAVGGKSISPGPLSHIPVLRGTRASCTSRANK